MSRNLQLERQFSRWYPLVDIPIQLDLINAVHDGVRFPLVPAGRRCLEEGTDVATPSGPVPIERLKVGDKVIGYTEDGNPEVTIVTEVHDNGIQDVASLDSGGRHYLSSTLNHNLWVCNESFFDTRKPFSVRERHGYKRTQVKDLTKRHRVKRGYFFDLIGNQGDTVKYTYSLGALLGDGCSRDNKTTTGQYQRKINISSEDHIVPEAISIELGCTYRKLKGKNYTYSIDYGKGVLDVIPYYREWCAGRYAYEKTASWEVVDKWDKASALAFLAGVIDTDGSIYYKNNKCREAIVCVSMQAFDVVDVCRRIIYKYFQEWLDIKVDSREKYVNGSVYYLKTTSNDQVIRLLDGIEQYLRKKCGFDVNSLNVRNVRNDRIGLKVCDVKKAKTYDITVGNSTNLYFLHKGGIVTSNSGKTERFKRFLAKQAMKNPNEKYFAAAPTHDQAKKIFWQDLKDFTLSTTHPKKPSESDRIIYLPNGTEIHVLGLDKPQRIEGIPWTGGGIDEIADLKDDAWELNIYPALNTVNPLRPDYKPWCWLLGVPDGLNHYYRLCQKAETGADPDYQVYHWKSAEVLEILSPGMMESIKRTMSPKQFKQEWEASFETASGRIYEDYSKANQTDATIQPHEQLHFFHDFNYTPMSSGVGVRRGEAGEDFYILDEVILTSAVARQSAMEFCEKFKDHKNRDLLLFGDPAGKAGEKHGHASDYTEMEKVLVRNNWNVKRLVRTSHPAIKDRQNAVRARILNAAGEVHLYVNPVTAPWCHKGLSNVQLKEGSTFQEDEKNKYQHITTAIGYCVERLWPVRKEKEKVVIQNKGNYMPYTRINR